jgi:hypothetical protein
MKSLKTISKLYNSMRALDRYLNPGMGPFPRQEKSSIDYVDLGENSDEGKLINHTESETLSDEYNKVSHMSFLTLPQQFRAQSGDEEYHDKKGNFIIPKTEVVSSYEITDETDDETEAGIEMVQLSVNDATASEEEADGAKPTKEPTDEVAESPSHEDAPKKKPTRKLRRARELPPQEYKPQLTSLVPQRGKPLRHTLRT